MISGKLELGGTADHEFIIPNGAATPDLDIAAVVSGSANANLRKFGPGQFSRLDCICAGLTDH